MGRPTSEVVANGQVAKASSGNAFDDILYNSDSDASDDDDEEAPAQRGRPIKPLAKGKAGKREEKREEKSKRREDGKTYIRNEGDEPMDLLSRSIAGGISSEFPRAVTLFPAHRSVKSQREEQGSKARTGRFALQDRQIWQAHHPRRGLG